METVSACEDVGQVEPACTPGGVRKYKDRGKQNASGLAQKGKQNLHVIQQLHL